MINMRQSGNKVKTMGALDESKNNTQIELRNRDASEFKRGTDHCSRQIMRISRSSSISVTQKYSQSEANIELAVVI